MANFTPVGVEAIVKGLGPYLKDLNKMDKKQQSLGKSAGNLGKQFTGLGKGILKVGALAATAAVTGIGVLAVATGALGVGAVRTAIKYESAFAGVIKTTNGLTDSTGKLNEIGLELRQGFVDLSKEVPIAFEELAKIGELGGQLGIGKESLLDFTETVSALGVTTNLTTEAAAKELARFSNIFGVTAENMSENIGNLGNSIVALGNEFATTEAEILVFGERMGGAGRIAGLTQADILGIGTAMSSVGITAEAGGTAVSTVLAEMTKAVAGAKTGFVDFSDKIDTNVGKMSKLNAESARLEAQFPGLQSEMLATKEAFLATGGSAEEFGRQLGDKTRQKALEVAEGLQELQIETEKLRKQHGKPIKPEMLSKIAAVSGKTAAEFKRDWEEDAAGAFTAFVAGLGEAGQEGFAILEDLGLAEKRLGRAFLSLGGSSDILADAIELANNEFDDGNALQTEAQKRYATTESQLAILKNTFRAIGDAIGSRFLPFINRLVKAGKDLINKFAEPIEKALDEKVIPAIEGIIALGSELFAAFQTGGTAGLASALGLTPETTELIDKIVGAITELGASIGGVLFPALDKITAGGILDSINTAIEFLNENFEAFKGAIIGVGVALGGAAIAAIISGIVAVLGTLLSPIVLIVAAAAALGAAWSTNFLGIRDILTQVWEGTIKPALIALWEWLSTNIPIAIEALSAFWESTLLPALTTVGNFIINSLIPTLVTIWDWLATNIPAAIATVVGAFRAVSNFVTGTLIPGFQNLVSWIGDILSAAISIATSAWLAFITPLQAVWTFISENILPIFAAIGNLLSAVIGVALTAAAGLWENVLLPALQAVWDFVSANILPIFESVSETGQEKVGALAQILSDLWEGTLLPALQAVWDFFNANIIPIFEAVSDVINSVLIVAIENIKKVIDDLVNITLTALQSGLDGIKSILSEVAGFFDGLTESVMNFQLPPFLQPGSPTPFETGLQGIATVLSGPLISSVQTFALALGSIDQVLIQIVTTIAETLTETITVFTATAIELIAQIHAAIMKVDLLIVKIYTVSLPTLQSVTIATVQVMVTGFTEVNTILQEMLDLLIEITNQLTEIANAIKIVVAEGLKLKQVIRLWNQMIDRMKEAVKVGNSLVGVMKAITAAKQSAAAVVEGRTGIGFQAGTGPLGFLIPSGFPNDTFPINVTSGERVLVAPPGRSIESIVAPRMVSGDTFNFSMTVNTMAAPQAVIQQFEVMRALVG